MIRTLLLVAALFLTACSASEPAEPSGEASASTGDPAVELAGASTDEAPSQETATEPVSTNPTAYVLGKLGDARRGKVKADLMVLNSAMTHYAINHMGRYAESLEALAEAGPDGLTFVADAKSLMDPWDRPYLYEKGEDVGELRIYTLGKDGKPGGEGEDLDIDQVMVIQGEV